MERLILFSIFFLLAYSFAEDKGFETKYVYEPVEQVSKLQYSGNCYEVDAKTNGKKYRKLIVNKFVCRSNEIRFVYGSFTGKKACWEVGNNGWINNVADKYCKSAESEAKDKNEDRWEEFVSDCCTKDDSLIGRVVAEFSEDYASCVKKAHKDNFIKHQFYKQNIKNGRYCDFNNKFSSKAEVAGNYSNELKTELGHKVVQPIVEEK